MNIPLPIIPGVVLVGLLISLAIFQIANKTVQKLKFFLQMRKIKKLLCEVTYQMASAKKFFTAVPIEVAREVLSPNYHEKFKAWSHHGDSTSFIIPSKLSDAPIKYTHKGKSFWISEIGSRYYFKDNSGLHVYLEGKASEAAENLIRFSIDFSRRCVTHKAQSLGRIHRIERAGV